MNPDLFGPASDALHKLARELEWLKLMARPDIMELGLVATHKRGSRR